LPPSPTQKIRNSFVEDVQKIYNLYKSLSRHTTEAESLVLAEQTVVSMTVTFEIFVSELIVTLISENSRFFLLNLSQEMKKALLSAGYTHPQIKYLADDGNKKVSNEEIREVILNDGDNLGFPETKMLTVYLTKNLSQDSIFDVTKVDEIFIDLLKSIRNLCAHHSQKAARTLSGRLKQHFHDNNVNVLPACRALVQEADITVQNIGCYLIEIAPGQNNFSRIEYLSVSLREIAFRWVP
jgi:hypothetical protein